MTDINTFYKEMMEARIKRLKDVNAIMYEALSTAWHTLMPLERFEISGERNSPRKCNEIVKAAMDAHSAAQAFEDARRTVLREQN